MKLVPGAKNAGDHCSRGSSVARGVQKSRNGSGEAREESAIKMEAAQGAFGLEESGGSLAGVSSPGLSSSTWEHVPRGGRAETWPGGPLRTKQVEGHLQVGRMVSGNYQSLGVG